MKIQFLRRCPFRLDHPRMGFLHELLFHGTATRGGGAVHTGQPVRYVNDIRIPLEIAHTGHYLPHILDPFANFVVSADVRRAFQHFPHVQFLEVVFRKLVDFPWYAPGDFSWYPGGQARQTRDPRPAFDALPDVPAFHAKVGKYYELLVPRVVDVKQQYPQARQIRIPVDDPAAMPIEPALCDQMLEDYPILLHAGCLMNSDAWNMAEQYIERDFFTVVELQI